MTIAPMEPLLYSHGIVSCEYFIHSFLCSPDLGGFIPKGQVCITFICVTTVLMEPLLLFCLNVILRSKYFLLMCYT
jgi:hypothetical protein